VVPSLGTFLSPDPVEAGADGIVWGKYAYGLQNPVNETDPSGLFVASLASGLFDSLVASILSYQSSVGRLQGGIRKKPAWPQRATWTDSDILTFRAYVDQVATGYSGHLVDCANVAVSILVRYAITHQLPVRLQTLRGPLDSDLTDRITTRETFLARALETTNAANLFDSNTDEIGSIPGGGSQARAGDLILWKAPSGSVGYSGHTLVVLTPTHPGLVDYLAGHGSSDGAEPVELTRGIEDFNIPGRQFEDPSAWGRGSIRWWKPRVLAR
jgi:hypothetical protein